MRRTLLLVLGILLATTSHAGGSGAQSQQIAATSCSSGEEFSLSLEKGLPTPDGFQEREVTFQLWASPRSRADEQRLLWHAKTIFATKFHPWPLWAASVRCDEARNRLLVTIVFNQGVTALALDVFSVPLGVEADRQPLEMAGAAPYAPAISPGSEVHYEGHLPVTSGGLKSVDSELRDDVLTVTLHLQSRYSAPLDLEVDLATGEVRKIERADGDE